MTAWSMEVRPAVTTPSAGTVSPGRTRTVSPTRTCSAGITTSWPSRRTRAVRGVRRTSFSMPALARATVSSSSRPPSCMMNATSPAAKVSPMATDATKARDTSTSALISKAVTSPWTASRIIGTPQRTMAIHAASKGSGSRSSRLTNSASPDKTRQTTSFRTPPHVRNCSSRFINSLLSHRGIGILYL